MLYIFIPRITLQKHWGIGIASTTKWSAVLKFSGTFGGEFKINRVVKLLPGLRRMRRQREIDFPAKQYDDHDSHAAEKQMTTPRKLTGIRQCGQPRGVIKSRMFETINQVKPMKNLRPKPVVVFVAGSQHCVTDCEIS